MRHLIQDSFGLFENRYLFRGDDFVGRFTNIDGLFVPNKGMEHLAAEARAWLQMTMGIPVIIGDKPRDTGPVIRPLPPEIEALGNHPFGDRNPALKAWIAVNRPEEYSARYNGEPVPDAAALGLELPEPITINIPVTPPVDDTPLTPQQKRLATIARKAAEKAAKEAPKAKPAAPVAQPDGSPSLEDIINAPVTEPRAVHATIPLPPEETKEDEEM